MANIAGFGAPGGIGQALTQPQIPAPGVGGSPEQMGLWRRFQERLKQDPNLRMALLTTGLNLLRTPQPGQSGFDVFADASLTGVSTLDQLRQREAGQAQQEREFGLAERRTAATEASAAAAQKRVLQDQEQFNKNLELAKEKLAEDKRQFNERERNATTRGTQLTGTERLTNAGVEALVLANPDLYPDTAEGRAKARLRVQGLEGAQDPLGQARIIAGLVNDLQENNVFMPEDQQLSNEEIISRAMQTFQIISGDLTQSATEESDPLEGAQITHPVQGTGKVVKLGENEYVVEFEGGTSGKLTKAQLEQFVGSTRGN